jgi:DNA polymerase-3 subunit delta
VLTVERTFKWGELLAANQALSLFGDKKLIELRIPTGKPGKDGSAALQAYAKDLSPDNLTLVTLPKLDWQSAKASWVTSLQQAAVYIDIPTVERAALPNWSRLHRRPRRRQPACRAPGNPKAGPPARAGQTEF